MRDDALATGSPLAACAPLGHCPLCGEPNRCRLETGEAYKGPCWCESPTVSAAALRRLLADFAEPRCLCPACLKCIATNPEISREVLARRRTPIAVPVDSSLVPGDGDFYWEGASMVFTEQFHLRRGNCCGSGCRHCPFGA